MHYSEYETIYVMKPEVPEDALRAIHEKLDGIIERFQGHILVRDDWGKRKLAYPVKKNSKGHYLYVNYLGPTDLVLELERNLRIDANLLRFLTVKLDVDVDVEEKLAQAAEKRARLAEAAARRRADEEAGDHDDMDDDHDSDDELDAD